jgi:thiosulfate dehydrogenase
VLLLLATFLIATLAPSTVPSGPLGATIRLGRTLVAQTRTNPLTKPYVGNALNCTSCHLSNGTYSGVGTFVGIAAEYPGYSAREKTVISLEDRIANCFMRSENGVRPPLGSRVTVAIAAYIAWLSTGTPIGTNPLKKDGSVDSTLPLATASIGNGRTLFAAKCASCHGADGAGNGTFPPLWGPRSYNAGAGLAHTARLAGWLKTAMPLGNPTLTDKQALDLAAFVDSHARPAFILSEHLPPPDRLGVYNSNVRTETDRIKVGAINP